MFKTEPQLNSCFDFNVRRLVMSSKMFPQFRKQTTMRRFQVGLVCWDIEDDATKATYLCWCTRIYERSSGVMLM